MRDLKTIREEIDKLDKELVTMIAKRIELVKEVGEYKKANDIPALAPDRWQQVLDEKKLLAKALGLSENLIEDIYNLIHEHALILENEIKES